MLFDDFDLHPDLNESIKEAGFEVPTLIQEKAIPKIQQGLNVRVSAQTGTGKTATFILPAINRLILSSVPKTQHPRILILVPTRELAMQVASEAHKFSQKMPTLKTVCVYGGAPYPPQKKQLSKPYDILVATPGRLIDHMESQRINLSKIEMFILDEADRMLDMGFIDPVEKIAAACTHPSRQTLLFSATMTKNILKLSQHLMHDSVEINVSPQHAKHENIEQGLYFVDNLNHKTQILDHLLNNPKMTQAIIFCSTKRFADTFVNELREKDHHAAALHGDMSQKHRAQTILRFRKEKTRILVATDIAARGIDIQTISHVINFDLPNNPEDYIHRIGRTGRAGAKGIALSFVSAKDQKALKEIEQFIGQKIPCHTIPGLEPSKNSTEIKKKKPLWHRPSKVIRRQRNKN